MVEMATKELLSKLTEEWQNEQRNCIKQVLLAEILRLEDEMNKALTEDERIDWSK